MSLKLEYSYYLEISEIILNNINQHFKKEKGIFGIKMDGIAIFPRARWSPSNNEIVGFCFNHKKASNLGNLIIS